MELLENEIIRKPRKPSVWSKYHITLFLMCVPALAFTILFHYVPLYGLLLAFKDYDQLLGIMGSPWTVNGGFGWFIMFVKSPAFKELMTNTLKISIISLAVNTILPIFYALFLNEVKYKWPKKVIQLIMYAPYFISTMVVVGMLYVFFRHDTGVLTKFFVAFGAGPESALENPNAFIPIYVLSGVWQGLGWWSIIYMSALSSVDPNLHDAAKIDGAGRWKRIIHVNLPAIIPLAVTMFIMAVGGILNVGFEKVYLMANDANASASNIISTYTYNLSIGNNASGLGELYSYGTAIGLFNSIINIIVLVVANFVSKKVSETSLW